MLCPFLAAAGRSGPGSHGPPGNSDPGAAPARTARRLRGRPSWASTPPMFARASISVGSSARCRELGQPLPPVVRCVKAYASRLHFGALCASCTARRCSTTASAGRLSCRVQPPQIAQPLRVLRVKPNALLEVWYGFGDAAPQRPCRVGQAAVGAGVLRPGMNDGLPHASGLR